LASCPPAVPAISDRLSSAFNPSAVPGGRLPTSPGIASGAPLSDQLPACTEYCVLQLHLRTNFQLFVGHLNLPAAPSCQLPACAGRQPSSLAFEPDLQLAPAIEPSSFPFLTRPPTRVENRAPPALPFNPASDSSSGIASSDFAFQPTRRLSSAIDLPTLPSVLTLRLSPASHLRVFPSHPASDLRRNLHPPVLSATDLRSQMEFESSDRAVDLLPTCVDS
jgi:hypothetical protein